MNPTTIITGKPDKFEKAFREHLADSEVAVTIKGINFNGVHLTAVAEKDHSKLSSYSGVIIDLKVSQTTKPQDVIDDLEKDNPLWEVLACFPVPAAAKPAKKKVAAKTAANAKPPETDAPPSTVTAPAKAGFVLVAVRRQP